MVEGHKQESPSPETQEASSRLAAGEEGTRYQCSELHGSVDEKEQLQMNLGLAKAAGEISLHGLTDCRSSFY